MPSITEQDKKILELVAKGESGGDYNVVNRVGRVPELTSMSLQQVYNYQVKVAAGPSTGAAGKYQFIPGTLKDTIAYSKIPENTVFSPDTQDYLITQRLYATRKYADWQGGGLPDDKFLINLAKEFASLPVPYSMQGHKTFVKKGQSYYTGVGDNQVTGGHDPDDLLQKLADIRTGGKGAEITLSQNAATAAEGFLPSTQAEIQAGGGQRLRGGNPYQMPMPNTQLPAASDPYLYVPISAESNRYDFRTGKKVRDLLVNGTNPVSNLGLLEGNGLSPVDDAGREFYTADQAKALLNNRVSAGYNTGQVDPAIARAAGLNTGAGTTLPTTQGITNVTSTANLGFGKSLPAVKKSTESNLSFGSPSIKTTPVKPNKPTVQ